MSPTQTESPAVVIDCIDHGESDMIVTFFTKNKGRITGIAKGAKRSKKRFVNKLELFSLLTINYTESQHKSLVFIREAELHTSFLNLRSDMQLYSTASVLREFLLVATVEREEDEKLFSLLLWALNSLNEKRPHLSILVIFLLIFFDNIGYRPNLNRCLTCHHPLSSKLHYHFCVASGGIICEKCKAQSYPPLITLSLGTLKLLNSIFDQPLTRLHRLHFSHQTLKQSLAILYEYSRQLLQRDIHSWKLAVTS